MVKILGYDVDETSLGKWIEPEKPKEQPYFTFISRILNPQSFGRRIYIDGIDYDTDCSQFDLLYHNFVKPRQGDPPYKIKFNGAYIYLAMGVKGSGKSAFIERISENFPKVIDIYGSRDDECLSSLRMHKYTGKHERGLILKAPETDVVSSWDSLDFRKLTLHDFERYDVIVAPQRAFPNMSYFFRACEKVVDTLWFRPSVNGFWFLLLREAANILYSRVALKRANLDQAKAYLVMLMREMRHLGVAMGLDAQYSLSVDKEVRTNADYIIFKNMGSDKIPSDFNWVYRYFNVFAFNSLKQHEFICKDHYGGLYAGWFKLPPWHKAPEENIYQSLGIRIEMSSASDVQIPQDDNKQDVILHVEIVTKYNELKTIKGTARATGHHVETVRKHVLAHKERTCSCFEGSNQGKEGSTSM